MADMSDILVPISPGELLDKITILDIKAERIEALAEPALPAQASHDFH